MNFTTYICKFKRLFCNQKPILKTIFKTSDIQHKSDSDFVRRIQFIQFKVKIAPHTTRNATLNKFAFAKPHPSPKIYITIAFIIAQFYCV